MGDSGATNFIGGDKNCLISKFDLKKAGAYIRKSLDENVLPCLHSPPVLTHGNLSIPLIEVDDRNYIHNYLIMRPGKQIKVSFTYKSYAHMSARPTIDSIKNGTNSKQG
ncbi:hypothetical protein DAMA08_013250 [Martiniozyma asiatica (nom. inval.)]|nr:hypothetical protein DAMA08_013250 [Martiniozyma asiatica]